MPEAIDSTGFDAILIRGRAEKPTAVSIGPDGATFHDADSLWGKDVFETEKASLELFSSSRDSSGKPGAVVIGPAGENLVRYAIIANDKWRCAGRTGVGAVMGSKRLKAIVFQGDRQRAVADPKGVAAYAKAFSKAHMQSPGVKAYRSLGTTMMVKIMNKAGAFPSKYWSQGTCEHWEKISGETYHQEHDVKPHACAKCFMACGRLATIRSGRRKGIQIEGPEYETIYAFGGLCMVDDIAEVAYLNHLCDQLGMDTITAGNLCALTIESSRRGAVDFDIDYGTVDRIATLIEMIARREGIGNILADGILAASRAWGVQDLAVHVKGMEPAGYDPRVLKGMGLTFGTAPRGACHLRTTFYKPELAGMIPADQITEKAAMLTDYEDRLNIFDTMILCRFYRDLYPWEELERLIPMVLGIPASASELRKKAAAIADMTRYFNIQEGLKIEDDHLPERIYREVLPAGHRLTSDEMAYMLCDYYAKRGWDDKGIPKSSDVLKLCSDFI